MHYKLSTLARIVIILNIILSLVVGAVSVYWIVKTDQTHAKIVTVMEEMDVDREEAIDILLARGEELYLGHELTGMYGLVLSVGAMALLYMFAKNNSFAAGMLAAMTCVFTNLIGGFLLFLVILGNKSQSAGKHVDYNPKDDWGSFIHDRTEADKAKV